jgi:hypothetical protein
MTNPRRRSEIDAEFREAVARMLRCITADGLAAFPGWPTPAGPSRVLKFRSTRARLGHVGGERLFFYVERSYLLIDEGRSAPRVRTLSYVYNLFDAREQRILGWHYHPQGRGEEAVLNPHLHVYVDAEVAGQALRKLHLPTNMVELDTVVTFLIDGMGVEPRPEYRRLERGEPRWRRILAESRAAIGRLQGDVE